MSAVLVGLFDDPLCAARVHLTLVRDGFPTDRIELTSRSELGRAGLQPARDPHECCLRYFMTVLGRDGPAHARRLAQRIADGAAAITIHPRGTTETARALEILQASACPEVIPHDLASQRLERAAAPRERPAWIRHLWLETTPETDCLYCRMALMGRGRSAARHSPRP